MQLILDADDIDIKGNMSTIEQESLNEKFLTNKIIEHLPDDVTTGNKENIQKQDNIIPDLREDDVIDNEKEIATSHVIPTNSLNEENSKEDITDAENTEKDIESVNFTNCKTDLEIARGPIIENEEESQAHNNEISLNLELNVNVEEIKTENEVDETNDLSPLKSATTKEYSVQKNDGVELIKDEKEENHLGVDENVTTKLSNKEKYEKQVDVNNDDVVEDTLEGKEANQENINKDATVKVKTKEKDETQLDLHNDDVVKVLKEEKDQNQVDIDEDTDVKFITNEKQEENVETHEDDIEEATTVEKEETRENIVENVAVEVATEKDGNLEDINVAIDTATDDIENKTNKNDIPNTELDDKNKKMECPAIEPCQINMDETTTTIEIDDDDEKSIEKNNSTSAEVEKLEKNMEDQELDENMEVEVLEENMEVQELDDNEEVQELDDNEEVQEIDENMKDQKLDENKQDKVNTVHLKPLQKDATTNKEVVEPKRICKLSNNLNILSDDEEDPPTVESPKDKIPPKSEKQCISIDDDDDIMLIGEDNNTKDDKCEDDTIKDNSNSVSGNIEPTLENITENENVRPESVKVAETAEETMPIDTSAAIETATSEITGPEQKVTSDVSTTETNEETSDKIEETKQIKKPLLPKHFIKTCKKNLADMSRDDLEEFCILKIVESIVDRSNLGEIKTQLKNLTQTMDECKKKCLMLSKQNKDLQVVLKSVQEEQKSGPDVHVTPLKITRSVGMQVVMMVDKNVTRKKSMNGVGSTLPPGGNNMNTRQAKSLVNQNTRSIKDKSLNNQQIPVPRLVPAAASAKTSQIVTNIPVKQNIVSNTSLANGLRISPPGQKMPEKRPRSQAVMVDLTDDEPPAKLPTMQRGGMNQTMRVSGTPPNILPTQRFGASINSPRKVYIPISGAQAQSVRPGQTIMLKTVPTMGPRQRGPSPQVAKVAQTVNQVRMGRLQSNRHPAPLPDAMKQYQPPNWKALPPAPDLKLSKVENGIVISWRIDGYQEENHEEIASYQLYAYQETTAPPSTTLWKKIGDVKALPLPMACTLTQFMAGYKYYFAVRAVDIRTRFGPFSSPGSILLLNKM